MKTLSYYQNLRESYVCIIPKTAPAYELIEALDALIASLEPPQATLCGVPVNLPEGWSIVRDNSNDTVYITTDKGYRIGTAYPRSSGDYVVFYGMERVAEASTPVEAIKVLVSYAR